MKLVLNQEVLEFEQDQTLLDPSMTLLRFLRENQNLTGTKEGCASGDCGACTVLVGTLTTNDAGDTDIHYRSVNTCIFPLFSAHRCHVVTVEHLQSLLTDTLYPSQQAMLDCHGSQCGFCTPGIVMSLTQLLNDKVHQRINPAPTEKAEQSSHEKQTRQPLHCEISTLEIQEAIGGNLCRCTGYRPIIDAGLSMFESATPNTLPLLFSAEIRHHLQQWQSDEGGPAHPHVYQPHNVLALQAAMQQTPNATLIAGGTDAMLRVTQAYQPFDAFIDLTRVKELGGIHENEHHLSIGAAVTFAELATLDHHFASGELHQLIQRIAATQIRYQGTIGGNIANASPIADLPPLLLALDATLEIIDPQGKTMRCALADFYHDYKVTVLSKSPIPLCITRINLPKTQLKDFLRFYKLSKRLEDDISSVMAAIRFRINDQKFTEVCIAYGGMAAIPIRATQAEQLLVGCAIDDNQAIENAMQSLAHTLKPLSDVRASAEYRLAMAQQLLYKAWLEVNGHTPLRLRSGHEHAPTDEGVQGHA